MGSRRPGEGQCSLTHAIKCAIRKSKVEQFSKEIQFLGLKCVKKGCHHPSRHRSCLEQGDNTAQPTSTCGRQNQPSCQKKQWIGLRREHYGPNPQTPWQSRATKAPSYGKLSSDDQKYSFFIDESCKLQSSKDYGTESSVKCPHRPCSGTEGCRRRARAHAEAHRVWLCRFPDGSQLCVEMEKNNGSGKKGLKWWCNSAWAAETGQQAAAPWYDAWLGKAVQVPLSLWEPGKVSTSELRPVRQQCSCCGSSHTIFPHLFK